MGSDYPPCFTFTPEGIAGVFLRQRAPTCGPQDVKDLGALIDSAWKQGLYAALEKAKSEYRKIHAGGCRMLSKGDECRCFLCTMDIAARQIGDANAPTDLPELQSSEPDPGKDSRGQD
jgi:hypothetical protein